MALGRRSPLGPSSFRGTSGVCDDSHEEEETVRSSCHHTLKPTEGMSAAVAGVAG
jgi:hypothetical protein